MTTQSWGGADGRCPEVVAERCGALGCLTLNRPAALNALSLPMVRALSAALLAWRDDTDVTAVVFRGMGRAGPFGVFCAGGDIRAFHQALLHGEPAVEDFFNEEYALNHLIHRYPKPTVALMDGVCMGGGMGIAQGCRVRVVTERSQLAMPEALIGLFPDVGGGWFLARCPGRWGEWLALSGQTLGAGDAIACGLADLCVPSAQLGALWAALGQASAAELRDPGELIAIEKIAANAQWTGNSDQIDAYFSAPSAAAVVARLEAACDDAWAQRTAAALRQRSPLMLEVSLRQVRRARSMTLAQALRQDRDLMRHAFEPRHLGRRGAQTEAAEGIRARVVDKDQRPRWHPERLEDLSEAMVAHFFQSPWPAWAHPLRHLD